MLPDTILLSHSITAQSQLQKLYIHPNTAAREKQTKFVDSIRFIALEIKEGIRLGANYNIKMTGKYILLIDYMNKTLFVYSKDGRFVKDINYRKLGENFYPDYKEHTHQVTFLKIIRTIRLHQKTR